MKAARHHQGALTIDEVDVPEPQADDALVAISTAGICHSDLHLLRGHWAGVPASGALGHEAIGVVEALGPGAGQFVKVGDRVILGLGGSGGGYWCGACDYCLGGEPRLCPQSKGILGTFAEKFPVYAKSLVVLPDSVGDHEAPLACGGLTAYGAVKKLAKHHVPQGGRVAVIGAAGGLGHYAVQIASAFGYEVIGIDVGAERLAFIESLGAAHAVDVTEAGRVVQDLGGAHASLVFAARVAGYDLGWQVLRRGGLFVGVGLPPSDDGDFRLNPFGFFVKGATVVFSAVGTVQDMRELVGLAAAGKVRSHVGRIGTLADLDTIFDELEAGAYLGRAVIDLRG